MYRSLWSLASVGLVAAASFAPSPAQAQGYPPYNQGQYQQYPQGQYQPYNQSAPYVTPTQNRQFSVGIARLAAGTTLPVAPTSDQGALYLNTDKAYPGTLVLADDVYDSNGNIALPAGTEVRGTFRPVRGGQRFFADSAIINGRIYTLRASSRTLKDVKDPRYQGGGKIAGDVAIGAAGGALIGSIFGNAGTGAIAGGVLAPVVGNVTAPQVVVVDPNNPIDLRLEAPLTLRF